MELALVKNAKAGSLALADRMLLSVFFLLATALGAFIYIPLPFTPVPLTAQTFFVLLSAWYLGPSWGAGVQAAYLALGAAGAPLFAAGAAGALALAGPTAGYLWAFIPASLLVAHLSSRCGSLWSRFALFASASVLILVAGTAWLGFVMRQPAGLAIAAGFLPFLFGDLVKSFGAAVLTAERAAKI